VIAAATMVTPSMIVARALTAGVRPKRTADYSTIGQVLVVSFGERRKHVIIEGKVNDNRPAATMSGNSRGRVIWREVASGHEPACRKAMYPSRIPNQRECPCAEIC
jgi:hypothetical protein